MNQSVFQQTSLSKISFFQKLFKQHPQENAVIELNNLLATKPVRAIFAEDIKQIETRYNLSLEREFKLNIEEFYATYLNYCLEDNALSADEIDELKHLKKILSLNDTSIQNLHDRVGAIVYKKSFQEAVADGRLSKEENKFLEKLEADLKLSKALAEKIEKETKLAVVHNYVKNIIADQRLSPAEENELNAIANSLNVELSYKDDTRKQLEKLKLYWALENLELPNIPHDIIIQKSERCHFKAEQVSWYELRSVRHRVAGHSTSFRIAKGFYLRSSIPASSYSTDEMKLIDTGTLYLTNKRIIFDGNKKNSNIRLEKIVNITPFSNGVEIDKDTGKSPSLEIKNVDVFCMILERLLRER